MEKIHERKQVNMVGKYGIWANLLMENMDKMQHAADSQVTKASPAATNEKKKTKVTFVFF